MTRALMVALAAATLAACSAKDYKPVVDLKGDDQATYEADLAECQALVDSGTVGVGGAAAVGAVGGGAVGAAGGAAVGAATGYGAGRGSAVGAAAAGIAGLVSGAAHAYERKKQAVNNCLIGRGHKVL